MVARISRNVIGSLAGAAVMLATSTPVAAFPFAGHPPRILYEKVRKGAWQLSIATNPFSGEIACLLRARNNKAIYRAGAVGFRFRRSWNTANAVYRIDGGSPRFTRDDLPDLVMRGTPIDSGNMENSSGGIVWIPFEHLLAIDSIAIQPRRDRKASTFRVPGLTELHQIALTKGCSPENRFVAR